MSIQQEEISIKEFRSGTTLLFFSDLLDRLPADKTPAERVPTIVHINNVGIPVKANTFDGQNIWSMNSDNIYVPTSSITNFITGYSFSVDFNEIISEQRIETIKNRFIDDIVSQFSGVDEFGNQTGVTPYHTEYIFSKYHEIDDFFVNVKLNRTTSTLDTLNVYNNLVNSIPRQEAQTGVVFGRLMALQTIKDSEGNNIKIPLRNVPVGVFNPSEDYPTSSSVSDNGDRIFLNLRESANPSEYFNIESFNFDTNKLLRSGSQFTTVPDQYKYITKTNDEGEFVIYDVPIGTQIVVFEVDLLKQGLTRDEIALNFFPFPPDDDAIIDQIPNFSFKQFPINVVPAWGDVQTGYTELDVVVNLDLRKWTTYFFPPVSLYRQKLEASVAQNAANSLKIEVRNMAKQFYPKTDIKLSIIPDDLDRVFNQQLNWNLEFAQIRNKAEFFKFGVPILKLPANLYDPKGYRTDSNGVPTNKKGVWLSAYQFNMFANLSQGASRQSGAIRAWNGGEFYFKSHFDLNFSTSVPDTVGLTGEEGVGFFPYEKPWTIEYPNNYSIPRKPTDERYRYEAGRTPSSTPGVYYLDEPAYNDGDLIGYEVNGDADGLNGLSGGFGSQNAFGQWFYNRIAEVVTSNFMYKYESGVAWNEKYANGYEPSNPGYPRFAGASSVVGGEKYQRFESGYGYFMRPEGWPRIVRELWGADTHFGRDIKSSSVGGSLAGDPNNPGPGVAASSQSGNFLALENHVNDVYNLDNINLALVLDNTALIKKGTLEAYRVINSNPDNLQVSQTFTIPTAANVLNSNSAARALFWGYENRGDIAVTIQLGFYNVPLGYAGNGFYIQQGLSIPEVVMKFNANQGFNVMSSINDTSLYYSIFITQLLNSRSQGWTAGNVPSQIILEPGEKIIGLRKPETYDPNLIVLNPGFDTIGWSGHKLPGNSNFNPSTSRYDSAKYRLWVYYEGSVANSQPRYLDVTLNANVSGAEENWYIKTEAAGGPAGTINNGLNADYNSGAYTNGVERDIYNMEIQNNDSSYEI